MEEQRRTRKDEKEGKASGKWVTTIKTALDLDVAGWMDIREKLLYYSERWASSGRVDDIWSELGQKSGGKVAERNFNKLFPRTEGCPSAIITSV